MAGKLSMVLHSTLAMTTTKLLRRGTIALIGLEFGLASAYFLMIWRQGTALHWLDFNGRRSLPSIMQAMHLFAIAAVCLVLWGQRHRLSRPVSGYLPLALASLCIFGGIDELTKLHLTLDQINWKLLYLALLAAIPLVGWRDLIWLWQAHRPTLLWIATGLAIFLLGGFGAEFVKGAISSGVSAHSSPQTAQLAEHLRITIEEFAELLGETVILYAFLAFMVQVLTPQRDRPTHSSPNLTKHQ